MPSTMDNPVDEEAMGLHVEANNITFKFVIVFLFKCIAHIVTHLKPPARVWINYYWGTLGEEALIMPPSPFSFIITSLCVFAEIKSQGSPFPFQTHPHSMNVVITTLLFYGLAYAAEHFMSATCVGPTSVYTIIARSKALGSRNLEIDISMTCIHFSIDCLGGHLERKIGFLSIKSVQQSDLYSKHNAMYLTIAIIIELL
ncbi:unnamed protein product [Lactuca saligna]|uniref:Uncharacterized protein n=1 Tax=Lactuca saligna TaxID=75948 RepID=A0AA35ZFQ7_LACSI|nr:unnamed protein product [Lactuca saligna]